MVHEKAGPFWSAFLLHLALVDLFHNLVALVALVDLGEPT